MKTLTPPDTHHVKAAAGWLELGNADEAATELEKITEKHTNHPDVLEMHWQVKAMQKDWNACVNTATILTQKAPSRPSGWIHRSFALHELGRTQEAHDLLIPALAVFEKNWIIPYNIACYLCQLDRKTEAIEKLKTAFERGGDDARGTAREDDDLKPLREELDSI